MKKIFFQFHNDTSSDASTSDASTSDTSSDTTVDQSSLAASASDLASESGADPAVVTQAPDDGQAQSYNQEAVQNHTDTLDQLRALSQQVFQQTQNLEGQLFSSSSNTNSVGPQYSTPEQDLPAENGSNIVETFPENLKNKIKNIDSQDDEYLKNIMKTSDWNNKNKLQNFEKDIQSNIKILENSKTYSQDQNFQNYIQNLINHQKRIFNAINSRILNLSSTHTQNGVDSPINTSLEIKKDNLVKDLLKLRNDSITLYNQILKDKNFTKVEAQKYKPQAKAMYDKYAAIESMLDKKENKDLRDLIFSEKDTTSNGRKDSPQDNLMYIGNNIDFIMKKINETLNPSLTTTTSQVESGKTGPKSVPELQSMLNRYGEEYTINQVLSDMRKMGSNPYENYSYNWLTRCVGGREGQCTDFIRNRVPSFPMRLGQFKYQLKIWAVQAYGESPVPVAGSIVVMPNEFGAGNGRWNQPGHIGICLGPGSKPNTYKVIQSNWITPGKVKIVDMPYSRDNSSARGVIAFASRAIGRANPNDIIKDIRAGRSPYT